MWIVALFWSCISSAGWYVSTGYVQSSASATYDNFNSTFNIVQDYSAYSGSQNPVSSSTTYYASSSTSPTIQTLSGLTNNGYFTGTQTIKINNTDQTSGYVYTVKINGATLSTSGSGNITSYSAGSNNITITVNAPNTPTIANTIASNFTSTLTQGAITNGNINFAPTANNAGANLIAAMTGNISGVATATRFFPAAGGVTFKDQAGSAITSPSSNVTIGSINSTYSGKGFALAFGYKMKPNSVLFIAPEFDVQYLGAGSRSQCLLASCSATSNAYQNYAGITYTTGATLKIGLDFNKIDIGIHRFSLPHVSVYGLGGVMVSDGTSISTGGSPGMKYGIGAEVFIRKKMSLFTELSVSRFKMTGVTLYSAEGSLSNTDIANLSGSTPSPINGGSDVYTITDPSTGQTINSFTVNAPNASSVLRYNGKIIADEVLSLTAVKVGMNFYLD